MATLAALGAAQASAQQAQPVATAPELAAAISEAEAALGQGDFARSEPLLLRAIQVSERIYGARHPQTVRLQVEAASLLISNRRFDGALELLNQARANAPETAEGAGWRSRALDNIAAIYMRTDRPAQAIEVLREALAHERQLNGDDARGTIQTASNLATLYLNTGQLAQAEALAQDLLPRADRILGPEHSTANYVALLMGQIRAAQGRYAEAEPLLARALALATRREGQGGQGAVEAGNLLARTYFEAGRYADAETLYRRVATAASASLGADNAATLITLNGLGMSQLIQGRHAEAERILAAAMADFERVGRADSLEGLQTLMNLATAHQLQSKFAEAEPLMLRAIQGAERRLGPDNPNTLLFISNLAELFAKQNRIGEAVPLAERALAGADRLDPNSPRSLLFASNLATFLRTAGRLDEALPYLERAFAGRERIYGFEHRDTLVTATTLAAVRLQQGEAAAGEALMVRIIAASERLLGARHPDTIFARLSLANFNQQQGRLDQAIPLYARVLADGAQHLPASDEMLIEAAGGLAASRQVMRALGRERDADFLAPARQAVAGIRARRDATGGRFRASQSARELMGRSDYYLLLADALWESGPDPAKTGEAFAALQDSAAGSTDRAVMQMAVRRFADTQGAGLGALVREREELEGQWSAAAERQVALLTAPGVTEAERAAVRAEAATVEQRLDAVDARLRQAFPDYFNLANPRAVELDTIAPILADDEVLLTLVPGNRGTHLMTVTREGITWRISRLVAPDVEAAARRLRWQLGANVAATPDELAIWSREPAGSFDRALAHRLYTELVAPMGDMLAGKRHVFVAATGALGGLPLGVLVTAPPQGADADPAALRSTSWLADAHALIQVPSVQSMLLLRRVARAQPPGTRFLGFGDPLLDGAPVVRGATAARGSGMQLSEVGSLRNMARLPGTAEELRNMRAALAAPAGSIFLGAAATERQVRTMDLSDVRILALATHGLMAGEIDGASEPGLVFTPPAAPGPDDDGYLAASEIAALRLNADWVILSACNTAAGDGTDGAQGLSGLARAFFYAGARTLLASHWPVRDDVGAILTVRAVQLQQSEPRLSRAEAFQRAMREVRSDAGHDWAHPNAWAPFTLIGDAAR